MRLSKMQRMDPIEFERFVASLFQGMGYRVEETQASGDEGIDLVVRRGRRSAVVQCKRYQGSVGQPVVRDLYGAMVHMGADEAYLVTTGRITRAARRWAADKPIHLVDGHRLVEWSRTRRLNYDKPSALTGSRRQWGYLLGLILLAVLAVMLVQPENLARLRQGWQAWNPTMTAPAPTMVFATATPSATPTPSSALTAATPTPLPPRTRLPRPTAAADDGSQGPPRPGPTVILTPLSPGASE